MAALDLEEQEQLSTIKAWWNAWGNLITWGVIAVSAIVIGFQAWNWYERDQSVKASAVFDTLQDAALAGDLKKTRETSGQLTEHFGKSPYASFGALLSAKLHVENGDTKTARAQLEWVRANAPEPVLRDLGRLRLAYVLIEEQAFDEAAKLLDGKVDPTLEARFLEARGDLLLMQDKRDDARTAYQSALARIDENAKAEGAQANASRQAYRSVVEIKLDAVGGPQ
jgi:predicted negative regulator of RcsB-dependent stress response